MAPTVAGEKTGVGEPGNMPEKYLSVEAAEAQLCQAQRMEIVGRLTGGVAHDFNNILTVITGTIEMLAESVEGRPELAAIAALIAEAAARGADLTSHLLAFARGQPSKPRNVDVNALLVEAVRLLRPTLGEQIEIESILAADVPAVLVDSSRLMTAVLHLAIAGRDAMPNGGRLTFETGSVVATKNGTGGAAADQVAIVVSAAGYGISNPGRDLGSADLDMVRNFIAQSHGHIEAGGEAGRLSRVEIYLPKAAALVQSPADDAGASFIGGGDESILIVEDDVLVRKYVVTQVQSLGYRTFAAGDAREALAIIDTDENIDLLLTDVMMPGSINGRQLAVEASNRRPSLKVLFTSGYSENAMVHDGCLDAGVLLLAKPYRKQELAKMIRTALTA
jgi:CheY-like chemotaxis protein